ncbi:LIM zinc-binding domain-containing protein [Fusarium sp. LHS14.1]|nr:LIM zinc-binding domain-containing protein [Fusarium sp. LHS14.1]
MDPLSIAASVAALSTTCLNTCKKLSDLAGNYQDVPVVIGMICSETTIISIALSELQKNILQRQDLSQAWASRTDILAAFETALTGCMIVFSCLEAETRQLRSQTLNSSGMRVWAKLKFLWNQDRLKELLSALRGQQSSINFLIQVLGINTLSEMQKNIRENRSKIQRPASEARSLQSKSPSIRMESQSIFDHENTRLSLFDVEAISAVAPSELDFDFDDIVLDSQAYRRVFAQAQSDANLKSQVTVKEGISLHISTATTLERLNGDLQVLNLIPASRLQQSPSLCSSSSESISTVLGGQESVPGETDDFSPQQGGEGTGVRDRTDLGIQEPRESSQLTNRSGRTCSKCSSAIIGQYVEEQGKVFHPDCFTCADCGEAIEKRFFPLRDNPHTQICELDYFRKLDLLCHICGQGLNDIYVAFGNKKYHAAHFRPEVFPSCFAAEGGSCEREFPGHRPNDIQLYGKS